MSRPENPSLQKEYVGKSLKYSGIAIGILGLLSLNIFGIAAGAGTALYGGHLERKNKKK